jgi:hypothetical protein
MQESSSSIGALAAALAKAQIELVNPEKSMTATIPADDKGGAEQVFRYAPLSSGLEILRKTLGQHEIAILQAIYNHALPFERRMGGIDLARLLGRRDGEPETNGGGAHLCATLCSFHPRGHRRRG